MGDIPVHEFMSLDGVIDEPRWTFEYGFDPKMGEALAGVMAGCQGILLGRITYDMFEPAWSPRTAEEDPGAPFMNDTRSPEARARRCSAAPRPGSSPWPTAKPTTTASCTRATTTPRETAGLKAPQRRREGPEVHGCPGSMEGLARVTKSVTVAGITAGVAETIAGSLGNLATVSDAWTYSGGRWGLSLPATSMSFDKHGSVSADTAAAKSAGELGS